MIAALAGLLMMPTVSARAPVRHAAAARSSRAILPVNAQIDPGLVTGWMSHANAIDHDPPYLSVFGPGRHFPPPPCGPRTPASLRVGLERKCFDEDVVTPPDSRLAKDATAENRVALLKHYVQKYHLPGFAVIDQFRPSWLVQKSAVNQPGADDVGATVGMIRFQLFMEEQNALATARSIAKDGAALHLPFTFEPSVDRAAASVAELYRRQRRLIDFWFPDGPVWTALLIGACAADRQKQNLPFERCCFQKLDGCASQIFAPRPKLAARSHPARRTPSAIRARRH